MTSKPNRPNQAPCPEPFAALLNLHAFCIQLDMIVDRLQRFAPAADDPATRAERRKWTRAQGFLKAASRSLTRAMRTESEPPCDRRPAGWRGESRTQASQ